MKRIVSWILCTAMMQPLRTNVFALNASDSEVKDNVEWFSDCKNSPPII